MQQVAAEFNLSETAFLVRRSAHGGGEGGEEPLLQDEENAAEKNENNHEMKSASALNCTANLTVSSSPNKEVDKLHHAACKYKSCTKKICVIATTICITSQGNPPIQEFTLVNSSYVRV
jgi:hypothetical protein